MGYRWKRIARRVAALMLACTACFAALAVPAFASGQVWLNWVYEPGYAGIHDRWYNHFEQGAGQVNKTNNYSCVNGWYGSKGSWVFGQSYCAQWGQESATPALRDPGVGAFPWAQSTPYADYLWAWVGYCGNC